MDYWRSSGLSTILKGEIKLDNVRVALIQAAPIIMDVNKTLDKVENLTKDAKAKGAQIVIFPEAFVPAYPRGLSFGTKIGSRSETGREDWLRYYKNSIEVPSKEADMLSRVAKESKVYLVIGITEKEQDSGTLYCTVLHYAPDGMLLGKHRKLKPTGTERIIWGEGDGSTLPVFDTPYGKMGSLICWENYMPLARMAMYSKGISIYIAPTADAREVWQSTIRHIALEGRCFVLSCNQYVEKRMYPTDLACYEELKSEPDVMCRGGSAIIDPLGQYIVEPVYDREEIIIADLNLDLIIKSRLDFDVNAHYARPDIFQLQVNEQKKENVKFING